MDANANTKSRRKIRQISKNIELSIFPHFKTIYMLLQLLVYSDAKTSPPPIPGGGGGRRNNRLGQSLRAAGDGLRQTIAQEDNTKKRTVIFNNVVGSLKPTLPPSRLVICFFMFPSVDNLHQRAPCSALALRKNICANLEAALTPEIVPRAGPACAQTPPNRLSVAL